jgi:hypothetical protein
MIKTVYFQIQKFLVSCLTQLHKDFLVCFLPNVTALVLKLKSLIHFELIFVYVWRRCLSFNWFTLSQLSQHHWWKDDFSPLNGLDILIKNQLSINIRVHIVIFISVSLICIYPVPVAHYLRYWSFVLRFETFRFVLTQDCLTLMFS